MDSHLKCWHCGAKLPTPEWGKIPFRATCEACNTDLHCCKNCVYYKPGLPNDCAVPGTPFISDRAKNNLCEDFKILGKRPEGTGDARKAAQKLFGDDAPELEKKDPKDRFDSLF